MKVKLKPEYKERWLKALRSGEYEQERGKLRGPDGYCCLGVLCDVVKDDLGEDWDLVDDDSSCYSFQGDASMLPFEVAELVSTVRQDTFVVQYEGYLHSLNSLNDGGYSFARIADLIEEQL